MTNGPLFETHAEAKLSERLGGGSLGMSTVFEIMSAAVLGLNTIAISMITNLASFLSKEQLSDSDVRDAAGRTQPILRKLLMSVIQRAPLSATCAQQIQARFDPGQKPPQVLPLVPVSQPSD